MEQKTEVFKGKYSGIWCKYRNFLYKYRYIFGKYSGILGENTVKFEANTVGIWANKKVNGANTTVFWGQYSEILENTVVFETNPVE